MLSTEIRALLRPPSTSTSQECALEFINTTFPSLAQLQHEDKLQLAVEDARRKKDELRAQASQVRQSQDTTDKQITQTLARTRQHLASARELSLARHALADELSSLSSELISSLNREERQKPTLLEELESLHRTLKELESVRSYVSVLEHALRLSEAAMAETRATLSSSQTQAFSPSSLTQYCQLQAFVSTVSSARPAVETLAQGQPYVPSTPHETQPLRLVTFLSNIRDRTWDDIKSVLSARLLEVAERMGWPQAIEYTSVSARDRALFQAAFLDLIRLQDAGDEVHASDCDWKYDGIYPIQTLTNPISLRFKFHFEGKRDTNRLDKPEWYFTHILNVAHTHRSFLESHVQPLLSDTKHRDINAYREFILHLLPSLTRKLRHTVPRLLHYPSLLAHTIYQALAFDASVKEQGFELEGTSALTKFSKPKDIDQKDRWDGISDQILRKKEWFEVWLEGERTFAEGQYNEIISSPDAWQVMDDGDEDISDMDLKPTNSARRVKALIEQITDRYQPLPQFVSRTRFLITIQIPILESYQSRIQSSLDAFETLSSSFVRVVPGALAGQGGHGSDTRRLTSGVEGVGKLVKAGISAYFMAAEMERWGEDLFFLELWSEINARAALRARAEAHPLLPDPSKETTASTKNGIEATIDGTIFQELVAQYRALGGRADDMIVRHVCSEVESASKAYFLKQWESFDDASLDKREVSVPTTLVAPISLLSTYIAFLARSLPTSFATTLYRRISSTMAAVLLQRRVLQRGVGRFTLSEAKQVAEECLLWVEACRMATGRLVRRVEGPWGRLLSAVKLLALEQDQFRAVVERIFNTDADGLEALQDELGVEDLDLGDLVDVVRLRKECWR